MGNKLLGSDYESAIIDKLLDCVSDIKCGLESTRERSMAITKLQEAIMWLQEGRAHE